MARGYSGIFQDPVILHYNPSHCKGKLTGVQAIFIDQITSYNCPVYRLKTILYLTQ